MNIKKFVASRIKDHKSNIVTQMWNIQQKLDDVIAMGRGDTDLDTPRHIIDAGINALNNALKDTLNNTLNSTLNNTLNSTLKMH